MAKTTPFLAKTALLEASFLPKMAFIFAKNRKSDFLMEKCVKLHTSVLGHFAKNRRDLEKWQNRFCQKYHVFAKKNKLPDGNLSNDCLYLYWKIVNRI